MHQDVLRAVEGYRELAIELQRSLTAIPAICPSSGGEGELDKALWLETELRKLHFDSVRRYDAPHPEAKGGIRPNLVARVRGQDSSRTVWIMSHLDVVPPGEPTLWHSDPYVLRVTDGRLYGRGVEDNHQAIVASILVVRALGECGVRPPVDLALLFCADEETGSGYGAEYLARHHPDLFGPRDVFLVPDSGNSQGTMIEVAEKSLLWLKIRTSGKQCHASTPHLGVNAFRAASDLVVRLGALREAFPARDELYDPPTSTFEPTKKDPNVPNINTIPGDDVFYLDCRVLPEVPLSAVEEEVRHLANEVEKTHGVCVTLEDVQRSQAAPPTSEDADVVRWISGSVRELLGVEPVAMGIGGGTVAAIFRRLGLAAVVYSRLDETAHQPNEYCILNNLLGDAKVLASTVLRARP